MRIYQKRIKKRKIKQNIEILLVWVFCFVGCVSVLNWSIGIFTQAGQFWFIDSRKVVIEIKHHRDDALDANNSLVPVAYASIEQTSDLKNRDESEDAIGASSSQPAQIGIFSAYNAEENQTDADPFTMASGKKVYLGAVANNCLPFGTKIKVNGKIKIVEDRMNSRYDCNHFDIFMESYDEAIQFGRRELEFERI